MREAHRVAALLLLVFILAGPTSAASAQATKTTQSEKAPTPKKPTWQDYQKAATEFRHSAQKEKSQQYYEAAISTLVNQMKADPKKEISPMDRRHAVDMCIHVMAIEGRPVIHGSDGSDVNDPEKMEALLKDQEKRFGIMQSAQSILKKIAPAEADSVAFEITKVSTFMAKTKSNAEKLQKDQKATQ